MTKDEWKQLTRNAKNRGDYYQLMTCIKGFVKYHLNFHKDGLTFEFVINNYTMSTILGWYRDKHVFKVYHNYLITNKWNLNVK